MLQLHGSVKCVAETKSARLDTCSLGAEARIPANVCNVPRCHPRGHSGPDRAVLSPFAIPQCASQVNDWLAVAVLRQVNVNHAPRPFQRTLSPTPLCMTRRHFPETRVVSLVLPDTLPDEAPVTSRCMSVFNVIPQSVLQAKP